MGWSGRGGRSARLRWGRRPLWCRACSARTDRKCRSPRISIRSVTSVRAVSTNLSAYAFARAGGRDLHGFDAGAGQGRIERRGELPGPVADQEPECRGPLTEVHQEVADLRHSPRPVRVRGDPEDVLVAGAGLDDEQAIQAPERYCALHMKEVRGEHRRGLRVQELPPCRVGAPRRRRPDPQRREDPADRGRTGPVTELQQLTLDPLVTPAVVLGGEPPDQRGDLGADRRPTRPVRVGPLPGDQAAVPPQDAAGGDQPVRPQLPGRSRIRTARTARSAQSSRGRGWVRPGTATSCRSTSSSAFLGAVERPGSTSHPQTRMKIR